MKKAKKIWRDMVKDNTEDSGETEWETNTRIWRDTVTACCTRRRDWRRARSGRGPSFKGPKPSRLLMPLTATLFKCVQTCSNVFKLVQMCSNVFKCVQRSEAHQAADAVDCKVTRRQKLWHFLYLFPQMCFSKFITHIGVTLFWALHVKTCKLTCHKKSTCLLTR